MNKEVIKKILNQKSTIFFIVIAMLFWFINKLNRRFTTDVELDIEIVNDYNSSVWIQNNKLTYFVNCEADGRLLTMSRLGLLPAVKINSSSLRFIHKQGYINVIEPNSLKIALQQKTNKINVNYIIDSQQKIIISKLVTKTLPIKPNVNVTCARQYMIIGGTQLSFDSITVKAPKILLDTINAIYTSSYEKHNATSPVRSSLDLSIGENILSQHHEVLFEVNIAPYTEVDLELPISIRNISNNVTATIIPENTYVRMKVPLDTYNNRFNPIAYIDWNKKRSSTLFEVEIDSLPYGAQIIMTDPQFVEPFIE